QILDVADQRVVAVVDRCAEAERRDLASLRIAIPLRREAEPRRPHREYAPAAGQDFVGRPAVSLRLEMHRQRVDPGAAAAAALRLRRRPVEQPELLESGAHALAYAIADFRTAHRG